MIDKFTGRHVVSHDIDGITFHFRRLPLTQRFRLFELLKGAHTTPEFMATCLVGSLCDDKGELLMGEEHLPQVLSSDSPFIVPACDFILQLNGLVGDGIGEAKKNLTPTPNYCSPTDSANTSESHPSGNCPTA